MSLPGYLKVNRHELVTELQNIGKKRERFYTEHLP